MYEELYHLQAKPFRLSPDPEFFFASRGHKRALAYLRYGLNQSEGFVVITGDPGTGKTTLAQILLQELGQTDIVVAHLTTTQLEADDMLRMVVASYGLRYEGVDKAGLLKTLEAFLLARSREHKRALLVVDEAQNLPPRSVEELRMLSNLQVGGQALLQIFMLGQAQFRQMLDRPDLEQLRQRVISNYHLSALAADECKSYVESRLTRVGWRDDPHITDEAYDVIFNYTAGIPRRINMLCDRVLLFSCLEDRHVIDEHVLQEVTDELQSETSGRPIQVAEPDDSAVDASHASTALSAELQTKEADSILGVLDESETAISNNSTISSSPSPERPVSESPVMPAAKSSGDSQIENAPDGNWSQSVAHARQEPVEDESEAEDKVLSAEDAEKLLDKERFRVITGGKKAPDQEVKPAHVHGTEYTAPIPDAKGDSEEVVLRKVLRLVLAFHRSPRSFPGLDDPTQPLPNGLGAIMALAVADDDTIKNLRQIAVLGISPAMLRAAVRFFIRRVLFVANADDYRILGLLPNASIPDIETHYGLIMHLLRQEKPNEDDSGIKLVGAAYERLCRSELSPGANEPTKKTLETSIDDDVLDLDLSPGAGTDNTATRRITPNTFATIPDTHIVDLPRKGSSGGRITLLLAALVIAALLYLSGIFGFDGDVGIIIDSWLQKTERVQQAQPGSVEPEENVSASENLALEESASSVVVNVETGSESGQSVATDSQNIIGKRVTDTQGDSGLTDSEMSPPGGSQNKESTGLAENISNDQKAVLDPSVNQTMLLELEARAEEARLAQQQAEAEAASQAEELASLKRIEQERLAEEARNRKAAEENAKVKARELQELKAELQRSAEARALAEAQVSLEAKARAEAELRAAQEAEINVRREEEARAAEQRRIQVEQRAQQAEELARQQALQQQSLQQQETEARAQAPIEEENQLAESAAEAGLLNAIAVEEVAQVRSAEDAGKISQSDLQGMLRRFEAVYRSGDIKGLINILATTTRTNDITTQDDIRTSYQKVFNGTVSRNIKFNDMVWEREDDYARGNGTYEFSARINGQQQDLKGQGEVVMQFERELGKLQITRFYFSDSVPDQSILNRANKQISQNALNDLTGKFVGAYETGNIELFMSLFTSDALSDGLGVQAIRQDYAELFANTTLREMNLRNMKWQWVDGGVAQGQSEYDVEVQFKGSNDLKLVHGKLWIHAQEWNGVPRIKELGFQE